MDLETLDTWFDSMRQGRAPEDLARLEPRLEKARAEIQGLAAVYVSLRAERQFAVEKAIERAGQVAAVFCLFHPANTHPHAAFYCRPLGMENVDSYTVFVVRDVEFTGRTGHMIPPYPDIWELGGDRLAHLEGDLPPVRELLSVGEHSEFQKKVLDAILLYTRSTMTREPVDKLVYIFAALESLLLKNRSEPIQTQIGDRLAFVLGTSADERKGIAKLVRECYDYRSGFLHHGLSIDDAASLGEFMRYVWVFFMPLLNMVWVPGGGVRAGFLPS